MKTMKSILATTVLCQILSVCTAYGQHKVEAKNLKDLKVTAKIDARKLKDLKNLPQKSLNLRLGTGDGGGGNSINYKMLESYIIDPNQLDVVKNRVGAILSAIFPNEKDQTTYNIFAVKNWYLAPINLQKIPKDVLGIEYTKDGHQQVALQTKSAVWINSNLYKKMSTDEQARLIVHEVLMSYYMLRFENFDGICELNKRMGLEGCESLSQDEYKMLKKTFKAEPRRKLNATDHEAIRAGTAWVFQNENRLNENDFMQFARAINLADPRNTSDRSDKDQENQDIEITMSDVDMSLRAVKLSGSLDKQCLAMTLGTKVNCELNWKVGTDRIEVALMDSSSNTVLQKSVLTFYQQKTKIHKNNNGGYNLGSIPYTAFEENASAGQVGSHFYFEFVYDNNKLKFKALVANPLVYIGDHKTVLEPHGENPDYQQVCTQKTYERLNPQSITTDSLRLSRVDVSDEVLEYAKFIKFEGYTNCEFAKSK